LRKKWHEEEVRLVPSGFREVTMTSKIKEHEISSPGAFAALKFQPIRETMRVARCYYRLISEQLYGHAFDGYWDEKIVMRWTDGRIYRGLGTCSALVANGIHKVEVVQNIYHEPSVGAGTFTMEVVTRQRVRATGDLIEVTRTWGHKVRGGKIIEISEHFMSLLLFREAEACKEPVGNELPASGLALNPLLAWGPVVNGSSGQHVAIEPPARKIVGRTLIPFENAVAWLSERGV